ncbi:feruloyl-CoA synthase [Stappia aggregata IAM 12614]|uniref:Feruloyl-CoA synthase n=1 Tax=Roseibium aggregatum (strain ATCC 25650 / DSM 13394 / JCM 20685 / NBRC 16684 / NCIMB 2208 / IAM 12614 / B1) TaxID=384765 RepID=A0NXY8_ROSAI|nr:feruloyl-CoA synthase [Roseibium aggregatum]EAV42332.1 feruloyl-CoA synthase [Stappia aggregata IAM 12614] [Roseibium aggregatum IAM 12614]
MKRTKEFLRHSVEREDRPDGTILLRSTYPLGPVADRTGDWLHQWAQEAPERVFLAERSGAGWREERYAGVLEKVRVVGAALLARGMGADTPILIMSGNGVDHGILALAAQYVGVPVVPVAEQYSLIHGAHGRLREAINLIKPKMAYVVDAEQYGEALNLEELAHVEIVASRAGSRSVTTFADLLKGDGSVDVDSAFAAVTPDTVGKILMTSGSTSSPKGVLTTHRMMCVNQVQLADSLPFLRKRPPVIVDWLPWNHVFGGSHNFNMMLANGGSFYIDDGKPVKGLFERTIENLTLKTGTLVFNVPLGFGMLLKALEADADLRHRFFEDLDLIFYAGASLPQEVWSGFERMAMEVKGEVPLMTSSWGLTETAPSALMQQEPAPHSGIVGVPVNGVTVKLIPDADMRCEVRVKGPNIMPGYFNDPEKTAAAFDEEGFFITGDAMLFLDPADPNKGMRFDGRISEDFKLQSGTWVRAAQLKLDMLSRLAPLASDLIITGADRQQIGVMIFPNLGELKREGFDLQDDDGAFRCKLLQGELHRRLSARAREISGSSTLVSRAIVLSVPASMPEGEMTAKGNLNIRKVLSRRERLLERLYKDDDPAVVTL